MEADVIMGQTRKPEAGDIYRHFKDKLYEIITIAIHSETEEEMVVYKQMYGNLDTYVRPLSMFLSEVDHEKYPEVKQKYRFERIGALRLEEPSVDVAQVEERKPAAVVENAEEEPEVLKETKEEVVVEALVMQQEATASVDEEQDLAIKVLMDFLDARTYGEKLKVLEEIHCELDNKTITNMALSMDIVIEEGSVEDRLAELRECIRTKAKYECFRLS